MPPSFQSLLITTIRGVNQRSEGSNLLDLLMRGVQGMGLATSIRNRSRLRPYHFETYERWAQQYVPLGGIEE
jgi:hypothetical protein